MSCLSVYLISMFLLLLLACDSSAYLIWQHLLLTDTQLSTPHLATLFFWIGTQLSIPHLATLFFWTGTQLSAPRLATLCMPSSWSGPLVLFWVLELPNHPHGPRSLWWATRGHPSPTWDSVVVASSSTFPTFPSTRCRETGAGFWSWKRWPIRKQGPCLLTGCCT